MTLEEVKENIGELPMEIYDSQDEENILTYLLIDAPWLEVRYIDNEEYPAVTDISELHKQYNAVPISIFNNIKKTFIYKRED